ncbi:hypothetical protein QR680_009447 [Steinernema hermaphroditum]|uniref:Uncharacterized protein n=1 Tax=Steinernema hermaphroditum TaxID=289476 RepID=A0AA39IKB3_9BILA|nr:hypothetical protein QR680_009447 [Steinernema hermaphroditum]
MILSPSRPSASLDTHLRPIDLGAILIFVHCVPTLLRAPETLLPSFSLRPGPSPQKPYSTSPGTAVDFGGPMTSSGRRRRPRPPGWWRPFGPPDAAATEGRRL